MIAQDKQLHFAAGLCISIVGGFVTPLLGVILGVVAGALKELVWDLLMKRGTPELLDFIYTVAGSILGFTIMWSIYG